MTELDHAIEVASKQYETANDDLRALHSTLADLKNRISAADVNCRHLASDIQALRDLRIVERGISPQVVECVDEIAKLTAHEVNESTTIGELNRRDNRLVELRTRLLGICDHTFLHHAPYYYDNEPYCEKSFPGHVRCLICGKTEYCDSEREKYEMFSAGEHLTTRGLDNAKVPVPFEKIRKAFLTRQMVSVAKRFGCEPE